MTLPTSSDVAGAEENVAINSVSDLITFSDNLRENGSSGTGVTVSLNLDLDLRTTAFRPIGTVDHAFEGRFLGNGHTLTVDLNVSDGAAGVFAYTGSSAVISGLTVKGSVTGTNNVGGIVGLADRTRIEECVSFVSVSGNEKVGGIAGNTSGVLSSCVSLASVVGKKELGGVTGTLSQSRNALIENTVFIGDIEVRSGGADFGGMVGANSGTLRNNYVIPTFSGMISGVTYGSVIGKLNSVGNGVEYCYAVGTTKSAVGVNSTGNTLPTLTTKTIYQILAKSLTFSSTSSLTCARYDVGFGYYPCPSFLLNNEKTSFLVKFNDVKAYFKKLLFDRGSGTELDPFIVTTAEQWKLFIENSYLYDYENTYIALDASISLESVSSASTAELPFAGHVDGRNNTVSFRSPVSGSSGLFSVLSCASIKDIMITGDVIGTENVGILAGKVTGGTDVATDRTLLDGVILTSSCRLSGASYVGGLIGGMDEGAYLMVTDCVSNATVTGQNYVGGLIGFGNGTVKCTGLTNAGTLSSTGGMHVGGVFGRLVGTLTLYELSNRANVQASQSTAVGGIGGSISATTRVSSCYMVADVVGRYKVGGLFGQTTGYVEIDSCAFIGTVTGVNTLGGAVGEVSNESAGNLAVSNFYCVNKFIKDKSVALDTPFCAFCIACPVVEQVTGDTLPDGCYEFDTLSEYFFPTDDLSWHAGKRYYRFLSGITMTDVYYNKDVFNGKNIGNAVGKSTVELTVTGTADLLFDDGSMWESTSGTCLYGYYPVPVTGDVTLFKQNYFSGGEGTESAPILISDEQQLRNYGELFNNYSVLVREKYFSQTRDIALSKPFFVIGNFKGSFNGNNHQITGINITVTTSLSGYAGFFGTIETGSELKNVCLGSGTITVQGTVTYVGGLAGDCNASIDNCFSAVNVSVTGSASYVGGLFGKVSSSVTASFFAGKVTGGNVVGGLIGELSSGVTESCFSTGNVTGAVKVGGLIGTNSSSVFHSMSNSVVKLTGTDGDSYIGGLIGENKSTGSIRYSFSNARLLYRSGVNANGLVGNDFGYNYCYYNRDYAPGFVSSASELTTEYISQRSFSLEGFTDTGLTANNSYNDAFDAKYSYRPTAIVQWANGVYIVNYFSKIGAEMVLWEYDYDSAAARGTESNPYLMKKGEDFAALSASTYFYPYTDKYFSVENNINMGSVTCSPIGFYRDSDTNSPFNGKMNGNGHTVSNLVIKFYSYYNTMGLTITDNQYIAMFGFTGPKFELTDLILDESCHISGGRYVASFVGYFQGKIERCLSKAHLYSVERATGLDAEEYQSGTYYVSSGSGYAVADGAFGPSTTYFRAVNNVGGFVGDLVPTGGNASAASIIGSVFNGTLPDVTVAYGFVGTTDKTVTLGISDSWYLTDNENYAYEESYGSVLVDYASSDNGGSVSITYDPDLGLGFVVTVSPEKEDYYTPFIFGANMVMQTPVPVYYLTTNLAVKFQVRYCQEVRFEIVNGTVLGEPILTVEGSRYYDGKYYFYAGETAMATYTWQQSGYYLSDTVTVGSTCLYFGANSANGTSEDMIFSFTMPQTASTYLTVTVTVDTIDNSVFEFTGAASFNYTGAAHTFTYTVGSGFYANLVFYNVASGSQSSLLAAGSYTVHANIYRQDQDVIIGHMETSCIINPIVITVSPYADFSSFAVKEYDGDNKRNFYIESVDFFVGVLEVDEVAYGTSWSVSAVVEWDNATSGNNKEYYINGFVIEGSSNYVFQANYALGAFTGGVITKHRISITLAEASPVTIGADEYYLFTRTFTSYFPAYPTTANVLWRYEKAVLDGDNLVVDTAWQGDTYNVGYYFAIPYLSEEMSINNEIVASDAARNYCMEILHYVVTTLNYNYNSLDLVYTGSDLSGSVRISFEGVGSEASFMPLAKPTFYRIKSFPSADELGTLYQLDAENDVFYLAQSFNENLTYYVQTDFINAGEYFVVCEPASENSNYVLRAPVRSIVIIKQTSPHELSFTLSVGGTPLTSASEVYYNTRILITFTDELSSKSSDPGYDALFTVDYQSRLKGGRFECFSENGNWYLLPVEYGEDIVFYLSSVNATNYENRVSETFKLTILPLTLYVAITHPEQVYGSVIDYSIAYYATCVYDDDNVAHLSDPIDPRDIEGLTIPIVTTGNRVAENVGEYDLYYNGGSSNGYRFNTSVVDVLKIVAKDVYVSVPSWMSNSKVYGTPDPDMNYLIYSDAACENELSVLENGKIITLNGKLSRESGENVGAYYITAGTLTSALNPNYIVNFISGTDKGKLVIIYRDINFRVKEGQGKFYKDDDQPYELEVTDNYELARGDMIHSFLEGDAPIITITRAPGEAVGSYAYEVVIDQIAAGRSNYHVIGVDITSSYQISRATPRIVFSFEGDVYFGDTSDSMSNASARAYLNNERVNGTFSWSKVTFTKMTVSSVQLNFTPSDQKNYRDVSMTVLVTPKKRVVFPVYEGSLSYVYDGKSHSDITVELEGTVDGYSAYNITKSVSGDNRNVTEDGFVVTYTLTSDYYTFESGATTAISCHISPAVLTVTVANAVISYGTTYLPTISYSGFVNGENVSVLTKQATVNNVPEQSGTYSVTAEGAAARNYSFNYKSGILTINKPSVEQEGIAIGGDFNPDLSVELFYLDGDSKAFSDVQKIYDKKLGSTFFKPLSIQMTSYYSINFSGDVDGICTYTVALNSDIPEGATLYINSTEGEMSVLDDYEIVDGNIVFMAGPIVALMVYEDKDTKATIKGYQPVIILGGAVVLLIMLVGIIAYFRKARKGKSVYHAERAKFVEFPHRK